ncbi:MAG: HAD hydrolase-like protein [Bacteroidetes bacterium]|nr:HAD hydrolase-like protein [Bacteroidota bacterium]
MEQKYLIFDWGDTLMVDYKDQPGPMADWPHVDWIDGAQKAMEELYKDYYCVIGSNSGFSDSMLIKKAFERINGDHYFRKIFASKEIGYEKPDLRFFQFIIKELGIKPGNGIMIGNDYIKDICGGKDAGLFTIFLSTNKSATDFPKADRIIGSMAELPGVVRDIGYRV